MLCSKAEHVGYAQVGYIRLLSITVVYKHLRLGFSQPTYHADVITNFVKFWVWQLSKQCWIVYEKGLVKDVMIQLLYFKTKFDFDPWDVTFGQFFYYKYI